jgi:hypothetical protein
MMDYSFILLCVLYDSIRGHQMVVWEWISAEMNKKQPKLPRVVPPHASMSPPPPSLDTMSSYPKNTHVSSRDEDTTTRNTSDNTPTYQSPTTLSTIRQRSRNTPTTNARRTPSSASRPPVTRPSIHSITPNRYWR